MPIFVISERNFTYGKQNRSKQMYRVYDKKETTWVKENIYLAPNNDLYLAKKNLLGNMTLSLISDNRYVYQIDTGLLDKNKQLIFEGDICKAIQSGMVGLISYSSDYGAYVFLDYTEHKWYPLGKEICLNNIEVVGNIFDNPELIPDSQEDKEDGRQTL